MGDHWRLIHAEPLLVEEKPGFTGPVLTSTTKKQGYYRYAPPGGKNLTIQHVWCLLVAMRYINGITIL